MYVRRAGTSARCSAPSPISAAQRPSPPRHRCHYVCGGSRKQRPVPSPSASARPRSYGRTSVGAARALRRVLWRLSAPHPRHSFALPPFPLRCLSAPCCLRSEQQRPTRCGASPRCPCSSLHRCRGGAGPPSSRQLPSACSRLDLLQLYQKRLPACCLPADTMAGLPEQFGESSSRSRGLAIRG
jgi:hypothetical protein